MTAERVQLRRTKGWRKPANTLIVSRPSILGNPFQVVRTKAKIEPYQVIYVPDPRVDSFPHTLLVSEWATKLEAITDAVETYRDWATRGANHYLRVQCFIDDLRLRGKNLACWCPLDQPCHADVLLDLANQDRVDRAVVSPADASPASTRTEPVTVQSGPVDACPDEMDQLRRIKDAALDWQAWAAAHSDTPEGNFDCDTVLYRVVSDYRLWCADEHTRLWADEIRSGS